MSKNNESKNKPIQLSNQDDKIDDLKKEIEILEAKKIAADNRVLEAEKELKILKAKVEQAQLEYDILEKAAELLKKVNGINIKTLKNKEKAIVINALRNKYSLSKLLKSLKMAKSSYEYQARALKYDKYKDGKIITYTVKEVTKVNGYTTTISGNQNAGYTITNYHKVSSNVVPPHTSVNYHQEFNDIFMLILLTVFLSIIAIYLRNAFMLVTVVYLWIIVTSEHRNLKLEKRIYNLLNFVN